MIQRQYYAYNKKTKRLVCSVIGIIDEKNNVTYIDTKTGSKIEDISPYFIKKNMYKLMFIGRKNNDTTIGE